MRLLRLVGASVTKAASGSGPAVVAAGWTGQTDTIRYLLDNGTDVNQHDKFGWTALIAAANAGRIDAVRYLIAGMPISMQLARTGPLCTEAMRRAMYKLPFF